MSLPDVVVLGVGGVGSAALYHLAARGATVVGLERFTVAHDRGSSHGQTRLIRQAYMEGEAYVPLARRAYELWDALGTMHGAELLHRTGLLYLGPEDSSVLASVEEAAGIHGLPLEAYDAPACRARFPDFTVPEGWRGVVETVGGYLDVEDCVAAHVAAARRHGAEVREGAVVTGFEVEGDGVKVHLGDETLEAGRLVITAGAWAPGLLASLGLPLTPRRVPLLWFPTRAPGAHAPGAPCFLLDLPHGLAYGFPALEPWGVKVAMHEPGEVVADPAAVDRTLRDEDVAPVVEALRWCLPGLEAAPTHSAICMYTMTPDEHFVVDRHPEHPQVVFGAGFSGHGFKFSSVLGEALADLALDGRSELPVGFLGAGRLR